MKIFDFQAFNFINKNRKLNTMKIDKQFSSIHSLTRMNKMNFKLITIIAFIFLFIQLSSAQGLYYAVDLYYDRGTVAIIDSEVIFSNEDLENVVNERYFATYMLEIIDGNGKKQMIPFGIVNKGFYDVAKENSDELVSGGLQEFDNATLRVYVPYYDDVQEIIIYDDNKKLVARSSLGDFSPKQIEDINPSRDLPSQRVNKRTYAPYLIIGIIVIICIAFYFYPKKIRRRK